MFNNSKYTKIYHSIISNAKTKNYTDYYEKHHIIPKSLGGRNIKLNIVKLSAREHFICHWLLTKMVDDTNDKYKMANAFSCMLYRQNDNQHRFKITPKVFEIIKKNLSKSKSIKFSGKQNPMYGKKHSEVSKNKIAEGNKNKVVSEETRTKLSLLHRGKRKSEDHRAALVEAWERTRESRSGSNHPMIKNGGHSDETKEKIRQKVLNMDKKTCPHCGKTTTLGNFNRWHNDNCKFLNK